MAHYRLICTICLMPGLSGICAATEVTATEVLNSEPVELIVSEEADGLWSVSHAANLLARYHLQRPSLADIPSHPTALLEFVSAFDRYFTIGSRVDSASDPSARLGLLQIVTPSGNLVVPHLDGPAWRSGIQRPVLLDADNKGWPISARVTGTYIDNGQPVDRTVTRGHSHHGEVSAYQYGEYTIIQINTFIAGRTVASTRQALAELSLLAQRKAVTDNTDTIVRGNGGTSETLVLDLRYCAGGDIFEATDFAGLWFEEPLSWISVKSVSRPRLALTAGSVKRLSISPPPEIVLISEFTASACEQLVQGLLYYADTIALGERTAGKCSVQSTFSLGDSHTIRFTTGTWSGPNRQSCDPQGIAPSRRIDGYVHAQGYMEQALAAIE